jgi:hypothetical protein
LHLNGPRPCDDGLPVALVNSNNHRPSSLVCLCVYIQHKC